jgi:DNA repair protein RadC
MDRAPDRDMSRSARTASPPSPLRARALLAGPTQLGDLELVTLLLEGAGRDQPAWAVAAELLDAAGGLGPLSRQSAHHLSTVHGLSIGEAGSLVAAFELGRRASVQDLADERGRIGSFDSVAEWARPRLAHLEYEEVWLLSLDGGNGLKSVTRVAQGGLHGCALTPRDVLRPALRDGASAMVLVHNHPSGDPTPSEADVQMTRSLARAAEMVGVPLLDHVVVARAGATSLLELGALAP